LDTGSARSRFTIYGQKDYLGSLYHGQCYWNTHKLFIGTIFYYERLLLLGDEAYIIASGYNIYWMLSRRCRYYSMELFILDLLHTSHVTKTVSSSDVAIIDVCIYSGIRFAPINVPNYASSVCITIFLLMTHVCHVL